MSTDTYTDLADKRDALIREAARSLNRAEEYFALSSPRGEKDARIRIDWASDALAEASRIDKMIGLL